LIFLAVEPISGKYRMLYLFLLVYIINGSIIVDTTQGFLTYEACKQYETQYSYCTPRIWEFS